MLGLAVLAALALTALIGAGSAMAAETTLCKTATVSPYCQSEDRYQTGVALDASTNKISNFVSSSLGDIRCKSEIDAETKAGSGEPLPVSISSWSLQGCNLGGTQCATATITNLLPFSGSLAWSTGWKGEIPVKGKDPGARLFITCGGILHCEWAFDPTITVEGGNPPTMTASEASLEKVSGLLCPKVASLSATHTVSSLGIAFVARAEAPPAPTTGLCKAFQSPCEQPNLYPKATAFSAESSNFSIENDTAPGGFVCSTVTLNGQTGAASGEPLPTNSSQLYPVSGCMIKGWISCTGEALSSSSGSLSHIASSVNGSWKVGAIKWSFICGGFIKCTYTIPANSTLTFEGGNPATIRMKNIKLQIEGGSCGTTATVSGDFTVTSPKPLWVTDVVPAT